MRLFLAKTLISLIALTSCQKTEEKQAVAYPVKVAVAQSKDVPHVLKGVGQLSADLEVDVKAQVSGMLMEDYFDEGSYVEQGTLLMLIDQRMYKAALEEARSQLVQAEAKLEYAKDFAETYGSLVAKEFVARLDYEESKQNVAIHKATIDYANALIDKASINLNYTEIRAPISGYVSCKFYDPGNIIDCGQNVALTTIRSVTPISVVFSVPSYHIEEIRERQQERPITLLCVRPDEKQTVLPGQLTFIDNHVNPDTGMLKLKGSIPNEGEKGWPGEFVRVLMHLKILEGVTTIPSNAIVLGEKGHYVFVVNEDQRVEMRMVGKSVSYEGETVIDWGIQPGDVIVTDGQLNLRPDVTVFIP